MNDEHFIVVGTGIRIIGQLTLETIGWIKAMDKVLFLTADPVAEQLIQSLNPSGAESLMRLYGENKPRMETYQQIVEYVLKNLRDGHRVCMAVYGHPGVLAMPPHEAIRLARAEGFKAKMLPAVSAEDCLFADLGVDQVGGCASFEATEFLINSRVVDPASHLILWQVGGLGDATYKAYHYEIRGLTQLARKLMGYFGPQHPVTLYEAPMFPGVEPMIHSGPLHLLAQASPSPNSTLYVPPVTQPQPDFATRHELGFVG